MTDYSEHTILRYNQAITSIKRLYEDNFIQFDGIEKEKVIDYVSRAKKLLESYGVRVELEGKPAL